MTSAHKGASHCLLSLDQGEAGYFTSTLTPPKRLCSQNINRVCWCPHKHDTYVMWLSYTMTVRRCDRARVSVDNFVYLEGQRAGGRGRMWGGGGKMEGVTVSGVWWEWLQGHVYASSPWRHRPGSILQVGWGLIVNLKYSWAHRIDKWRYKNTVKFSIGQMSLTSPDTIYCDLTFAAMPINMLRAWKETLMAFSIYALWSNLHWDGYRQD